MDEDEKILRSIIKHAQREGMPSTFRLCRDDRKYGDILFSNVDNIKSIVRVGMGDNVIICRKDLVTIDDWINFCQAVSNGFSYCYGIDPTQETPIEVKTLYDFAPSIEKIAFDVIGIMPKKGSKGWIFTFTSIRQEQSVPEITTTLQLVLIHEHDEDYIVSSCVDFIIKSTAEKSMVNSISVTNTTINLNETRNYNGKSDDDLTQLLIELITKVEIERLSKSTLIITTAGNDTWLFLLKKYEIEF